MKIHMQQFGFNRTDGRLKNPAKCLWRWEPDRRYNNFFFSPPAHRCAVTYMTEIPLIVTLNNQFTYVYLHGRTDAQTSGTKDSPHRISGEQLTHQTNITINQMLDTTISRIWQQISISVM